MVGDEADDTCSDPQGSPLEPGVQVTLYTEVSENVASELMCGDRSLHTHLSDLDR